MMLDERCMTIAGSLPRQVAMLWHRQSVDWPLLASGLASLKSARTRSLQVGTSQIVLQSNPARSTSASAKVDAASLAARPCFLCVDNLPEPQRAISYRERWLILCNPAPIFAPHFVISSAAHQPQRLGDAVEPMLKLSKDLEGGYTVFYNGPLCGASAPDHLHLQATPAGAMPFEQALARQLAGAARADGQHWLDWIREGEVRVGTTRPSRPPAVVLVSASPSALAANLGEVIEAVGAVHPAEPEPMVNLFASYYEERWIAWLFPRAAHRPSCYGHGPDNLLVSPGAIDLGGVLIVPRGEDFDRIEAKDVARIFAEVLLSPGAFARVRERLAGR